MRTLIAVPLVLIGFGMMIVAFGGAGPGDREEDRDALRDLPSKGSISRFGVIGSDDECPELFEPAWIAVSVDEGAAVGVVEYLGRAERWALDALLDGTLDGFFRLDNVFWLFENGEVERLDEDLAFGETIYLRADRILSVTPLKDGFPEAARQLMPGDRLVPGPGRDA